MAVLGLDYFTPLTGLAGGALIGLSAGTLLLFSGDILGASGVVSSALLSPQKAITDPSTAWKLVLLSVFSLFSTFALGPHFTDDGRYGSDPSIPVASVTGFILAGLLVGFGTRLGNGCTTGHGICGMARLSKRSFIAVITFMGAAVGTANVVAPDNKAFANGTKWLRQDEGNSPDLYNKWLGFGVSALVFFIPTLLALYNMRKIDYSDASQEPQDIKMERRKTSHTVNQDNSEHVSSSSDDALQVVEVSMSESSQLSDHVNKIITAVFAGLIFATGLAVSGMVLPSKVLGFLNLTLLAQKGAYDPTLMTVMGGGLVVSFICYQFVESHGIIKHSLTCEKPLSASKFSVPNNKTIDAQLIVGAACFGIGWGVAGLCPGPAIFLAATGTKPVIFYWWPAFLLGSFSAQQVKDRLFD